MLAFSRMTSVTGMCVDSCLLLELSQACLCNNTLSGWSAQQGSGNIRIGLSLSLESCARCWLNLSYGAPMTIITSCEAAGRLGHMRASSASEAWYVCLTTRYGGDRLSTVQTTWIKPVPIGRCTMPTLNQSYDAPMTNIS